MAKAAGRTKTKLRRMRALYGAWEARQSGIAIGAVYTPCQIDLCCTRQFRGASCIPGFLPPLFLPLSPLQPQHRPLRPCRRSRAFRTWPSTRRTRGHRPLLPRDHRRGQVARPRESAGRALHGERDAVYRGAAAAAGLGHQPPGPHRVQHRATPKGCASIWPPRDGRRRTR